MSHRRNSLVLAIAVASLAAETPCEAATVRGTLTIAGRGGGAEDPTGAVVWLEAGSAGAPAPGRAVIDMKDKTFLPAVVAVPVGSTVTFPNGDPILHNVFSVSDRNEFDLGLYGRGDGRAVSFPAPGVVRVFCNVHPQMEAFVVVTPGPWRTFVAPDGSFAIEEAPPGRYSVWAWDRRGGLASQPVEVGSDASPRVDFRMDASRYRRLPHLDKNGRPYAGPDRY
jgi:plastocyanin